MEKDRKIRLSFKHLISSYIIFSLIVFGFLLHELDHGGNFRFIGELYLVITLVITIVSGAYLYWCKKYK